MSILMFFSQFQKTLEFKKLFIKKKLFYYGLAFATFYISKSVNS